MPAPNRQMLPLGKWPATDDEAQCAGLQKVVRISDGSVTYAHAVDAKELVAGGEYRWERWP